MTKTDSTSKTSYKYPFTVRRVGKPKTGFVQVSNDVIRNGELSSRAFHLLCYLMSHEDGFGLNWVAVEKSVLHCVRNTRKDALRELIEKRYVRWALKDKLLETSDTPFPEESPADEVSDELEIDAAGSGAGVESMDVDPNQMSIFDPLFTEDLSKNDSLQNTTYQNTTNNSEHGSGSTHALNDLKESSDKSGSRSRANATRHASTVKAGETEDAITWIEERIERTLEAEEFTYCTHRLERWELDGKRWAGLLSELANTVMKAEALDVPVSQLRSVTSAA